MMERNTGQNHYTDMKPPRLSRVPQRLKTRIYPFLKIVQWLLRIFGGGNAILGLSFISLMLLASAQISNSLDKLNINSAQFFTGEEWIAG